MANQAHLHILLLAGILTLIGIATATDCADTWMAFDGSCYLFGTDTPRTFVDAEHFCQQHKGHLVHVDNAKENAFIKNFIGSLRPTRFWIGLTDERIESLWTWYDSQASPNFTDWHPGQPDNYQSREDCVELSQRYSYMWNDAECDIKMEPICEIRYDHRRLVLGANQPPCRPN